MDQATALPQLGHLKRSLPLRFTIDHGTWSIGTWLISHDGSHVTQNRKASVSLPPTGSSTDGWIATNPRQVEQYRAGKKTVMGFFVGQIMKATNGQANPKLVNDLLSKKLE